MEWGLVYYVDFAICMHIKAFSRCNLVILFEFKNALFDVGNMGIMKV